MGYPLNNGGCFYLDTDASGFGIGSVLSQEQSGQERVIAYASRGMSRAEKNYCITEKELLAVVFFMQYFRQYLLGRKFVVRTDHQALVWLLSLKEPSGKIARWIEVLSPFNFSIEYRAGKKMGHVDGLSRCENPKDCTCPEVDTEEILKCGPCSKCRRRAEQMLHPMIEAQQIDEAQPVCSPAGGGAPKEAARTIQEEKPSCSRQQPPALNSQPAVWLQSQTSESLAEQQSNDPHISPILKAKVEGTKPSSKDMEAMSPETRHYWVIWDILYVEAGVLYRKKPSVSLSESTNQLVVPGKLRSQLLQQGHNSLVAGHFGVRRTKARISQTGYWYNMKSDVKWHVRKCDTCAADKPPAKTPKAPMGHLKSGAPWDTLAIDYLGPFPCTARGNRYILVMTDHFTKYVEVVPVPSQHAEDCASRILNEFVSRWGTPLNIYSDQGGTFESRVFRELCQLLQVQKTRTSARNPKGNGQTERFNRTLLRMIRAYLAEEQEEWDLYLGCIAGAYRSTPNESTGLTPNLLALGREVRLPADVIFHPEAAEKDPVRSCDYVQQLKDKMALAHEIARKNLLRKAERSKEIYDTKMVLLCYQPGDLVWCRHETRQQGVAPKLKKQYDGPFVIISKKTPINYVIKTDKNGAERLVHHDKLKRYEGEKAPKWATNLSRKIKAGAVRE